MAKKSLWTRRDVLQAAAAGSLAFAGRRALATGSTPAAKTRQHLINIHGFGGWDTTWFTMPMSAKDTLGMTEAERNKFFRGFYNNVDGPPLAERYTDNEVITRAGILLGPGMGNFTDADVKRLCLWRGMAVQGSHGTGNFIVNTGHTSPYATCFSSLISAGIAATDYVRPLHYVCANPGANYVGQALGYAIPTTIASRAAFEGLGNGHGGDPSDDPKLLAALGKSIESLRTSGTFVKDSSRQLIDLQYASAYASADLLMKKKFATNPEFGFAALVDGYVAAVRADYEAVCLPMLRAKFDYGATPFENLGVANDAFNFALAEFLVTQDLSAVVTIPARFGDFHDGNAGDLASSFITMSLFRHLTARLDAAELPDGSGRSLLDVTLVALSSEMDREIERYHDAQPAQPGANHGPSNSIVMAGHRAKRGFAVGRRMNGPSADLGGAAKDFGQPVRLDIATGQPKTDGEMFDSYSIAPTILEMFSMPVPARQQTAAKVFTPVIQSGVKI